MLGLALVVLCSAAADEPVVAPATLEGRPAPEETSPLQARIDAAAPGALLVVGPGDYRGDIVVDRPLTLRGQGRPRLLGAGRGSVIRVRAPDVTLDGFDIDGLESGDLGRDSAGIHVAAPRATVVDCRIVGSIFGVYLREANGVAVRACHIRGIPGKDAGEKGSGIHVWNTDGFHVEANEIVDVRDGFYIQSSTHGSIRGNVARDLRYGLHYMFSDDNTFEDNTFENDAAGAALMYSRRLVFRRNRFLHNRGFASVGLLLKACDDVVAEDNLVADNARGLFIEGSYRNVFRRNVVALSDVAIVLYDSSGQNRFEGNSFVGNLTPLTLVGHRTDTVFTGNYWSQNGTPDLDGDGRSDGPYRLTSVFDHFRENLTAADLMAQGLGASALAAAEATFPVLRPVAVEDVSPLARPPLLPNVPLASSRASSPNRIGLAAGVLTLAAGALVMARGRR